MRNGDSSGDMLNHHLKDSAGTLPASDGSSAPIGTYKNECPIINIATAAIPSPARAPALIAHIVPSTLRRGELSLRLYPRDRSWDGFLTALSDAGFAPGDVVRIEAVRAGSPPTQERIDGVALAIIGGEPMDAEELQTAREIAVDVLRAFAEMDRAAGREPIDTFDPPAA